MVIPLVVLTKYLQLKIMNYMSIEYGIMIKVQLFIIVVLINILIMTVL